MGKNTRKGTLKVVPDYERPAPRDLFAENREPWSRTVRNYFLLWLVIVGVIASAVITLGWISK